VRQQINRWTLFHAVVLSTTVAMGAPLSADPFLARLELAVEIVDETGEAVPGSMVTASFRHTDKQRKKAGITKKFQEVYDGNTPVHFRYTSERNVALWVEKEGYWLSGVRYKFPEVDRMDKRDGSPNGHYRKEFKIILRKKENPRPLYLYKVDWVKIPGYDQPYGYDLEKADWVAPHGEGVHADFVFTARGERKSKDEFRMDFDLSFMNPNDGLIEVEKSETSMSQLLLGRIAPTAGYTPQHTDSFGVESKERDLVSIRPDRQKKRDQIEGYWFRVRSDPPAGPAEDMEGRYGKIVGPIRFSGRPEKNPSVSFTYFLSPDRSRSLEFNGENLMKKRGGNLTSLMKN